MVAWRLGSYDVAGFGVDAERGPAAVDGEHRTGDVRRRVRQQGRDDVRHLVGASRPAERVQTRELGGDLGTLREHRVGPLRGDRAERHRVAPDPARRVVDGDRPRQPLDGCLRGGVGERAGDRALRLVRRHVDDRPGGAGVEEGPDGDRASGHGEPQVGQHQVGDVLGRGAVQVDVAEDGGVVDPASQRGEVRGATGGLGGHGLVARVARDARDPGRLADPAVGGRAGVEDHHVAVSGEPLGDRASHSVRAAGDDVRTDVGGAHAPTLGRGLDHPR